MADASNVRNVNPDKSDKAPDVTHGAPGQAHSSGAIKRLTEQCRIMRLKLAPGTPEKYPGTTVRVGLLDLEAALRVMRPQEEEPMYRNSTAFEAGCYLDCLDYPNCPCGVADV